jgi:pimeloyl-ACP methyl ester carboxylesterase
MPFVEVGTGDRLHYIDLGRGAPCVVLHGFGMRAAHFLPFLAPLALRHRFILLDLRGFGGSRHLRLRDPDLLDSHALDLHDAIRALRLERPALAGISMGAATSLAYLRRFGFDGIRAYAHMDQSPRILNDTFYGDGLFGGHQARILGSWGPLLRELEALGRETPYAELPRRLRRELARKLAEFFSYAFERRALHAATVLVRLEALAKRVLHVENWPLYADAIGAYLTRDYDFRPSLAHVKIPMHVFVGMKSRMYPPAGQVAMQDFVPHARVVRFERSGHAIIADEPVRFVRAMREFLREAAQ